MTKRTAPREPPHTLGWLLRTTPTDMDVAALLRELRAGADEYLQAMPTGPIAIYMKVVTRSAQAALLELANDNLMAAMRFALHAMHVACRADMVEVTPILRRGLRAAMAGRKNASLGRALDKDDEARLVKAYQSRVAAGEKHGAINALGHEFRIRPQLVTNILKRHGER